jgi:hypothetical protein
LYLSKRNIYGSSRLEMVSVVRKNPDKVIRNSQIGTRIGVGTTGLENTVFVNENIVKVGDDQKRSNWGSSSVD